MHWFIAFKLMKSNWNKFWIWFIKRVKGKMTHFEEVIIVKTSNPPSSAISAVAKY